MKKILSIFLSGFLCAMAFSAPKYVIDYTEPKMVMPDGAIAEVSFFKKFGDASKFAKEKDKEKEISKKRSLACPVEEDTSLGYANIWHQVEETGALPPFGTYKEHSENKAVKRIYDVMKECGATYGIAYADFDKRIRRYSFEFDKKGRLRNTFVDYFDLDHEFVQAFYENNYAKMEEINLFFLKEQMGVDSEEFQKELYRIRHSPRSVELKSGESGETISESFSIYYILSDDGYSYTADYPNIAVDGSGNFIVLKFKKVSIEKGPGSTVVVRPISGEYGYFIEMESVPENIIAAAQKSLDK